MNSPSNPNPRLLLLQIRDEPKVRDEEYASFLKYAGLEPAEVDVLNVFDTPDFATDVITGYDALLVGGASEASVLEPENYPFVAPCIRLLTHCIDQDIPVFASCFGFQLAVLALGGTIVRDESQYEMGTPVIELTPAAAHDPLFKTIGRSFPAVSVHMERTTDTPAGCELLAFTIACPHAFRVINKPFWAFQFHPEVDLDTLIERLTVYKEKYTEDDGQLDEVLSSAVATPESNGLLRSFVDVLQSGAF